MVLKVKICGVKSLNQTKISIKGKAKMIGLMLYKESPRYIDLKTAKKISIFAKKKIQRVGVVANLKIPEVKSIIKEIELDFFQFHGAETLNFLKEVKKITKIKIIKALKVSNKNDIKKINNLRKVADYILIDTKIINKNKLNLKNKTKKLNWNLLKNIKNKNSLILSGALNIKNLEEATKTSNIKFVDVSSSLETSPGKKSTKKINKFLKLATKL